MKLWEGRLKAGLCDKAALLNSSIGFDARLLPWDIRGSIAHATMLSHTGIISAEEAREIVEGLKSILEDVSTGKLEIDMSAEDVHTFVEAELTARIGEAGKKLHTARSRNDQVALDTKLFVIDMETELISKCRALIETLIEVAQAHLDSVMPGYTHLQRAQPVTLAHVMMAYAEMLLRDMDRLYGAKKRANYMPLGAGALAGTTFPIDRDYTAQLLGFDALCENSMDAVSDRDFVTELISIVALSMTHLSRMAEELVIWSSAEFGFVELSESYSTGSSIMPQKKNPDIAELIRGKAGRTYGDLMTMLTVQKGLPLAYNKDMQEDKEPLFDAVDTYALCLDAASGMLKEAKFNTEKMEEAAKRGYINATDCADYLAKHGVPFRDAYKAVGELVNAAIAKGLTPDKLPLEDYKAVREEFGEDIYEAIDLRTCLNCRAVKGGPAPQTVSAEIDSVKRKLNQATYRHH